MFAELLMNIKNIQMARLNDSRRKGTKKKSYATKLKK